MTDKPEIMTVLVISTAHISKATDDFLTLEKANWPVFDGNFCWIVHVPEDITRAMELGLPVDLSCALMMAKAMGFEWLRLDADGPLVEGLPTFEW